MAYTRLVLFNTMLLMAPSPNEKSVPPARHRMAFRAVEPSGVIIDTIINKRIPPPSEHYYARIL